MGAQNQQKGTGMKRPYHLTPGASQGNAFTAHIDGRTQIQWSAGQHTNVIAQKASQHQAAQRAAGKSPGTIKGLAKAGS